MTEIWINSIAQIAATILASAVSVWIAIHLYKKESERSNIENIELKKINKINAIDFIDFACSSLMYLSAGPNIIEQKKKEAEIELEKIIVVNRTLEEIKSTDLPKCFVKEYQNCKIILKILEIEIRVLLDDILEETFKSDYFETIDLTRRMKRLLSVVDTYRE